MSWNQLPEEEALTEGSALWFVSDLDQSKWAQKINWYLNFQLRRAKAHQSKEFPQELVAVVQTWEVEAPQLKLDPKAPLLIESSKLLPNQMTVQILEESAQEWIEQAKKIWISLQKPSVRVFLPPGVSQNQLIQAWDASSLPSGTFIQE